MRMIVIAGMVVLAGCVAQPVQQATPFSSDQATEGRQIILTALQCPAPITAASCRCMGDRMMSFYNNAEAVAMRETAPRLAAAMNAGSDRLSSSDLANAGLFGFRVTLAQRACNVTAPNNQGILSF